ncbi:MAG: DNA mismatch repair protein MutS [Desulfobacteraceae bacterium]|nr:MAG: DNA mismatch repair protein MutS [Desulfobacteraceae bacterium]
MKPPESSPRTETSKIRSFEELKAVLEKKAVPLPKHVAASPVQEEERTDPEAERRLFLKEMEDVAPITGGSRAAYALKPKAPEPLPEHFLDDRDADVLDALETLIREGKGFVVAQTPEYIEGRSPRVHPAILNRLHRGDFSIQAHIDLHGLSVESAREALEAFLKSSISSGKRAVLIIHGRGLSSPQQPVLKTKVYEWLTTGNWKKWVIAFSSARACDGGAGATYLLLRRRPLTKRMHGKKARCRTWG